MIRFQEPRQTRNPRTMSESLRFTAHDVERQSGETNVDFSSYYVLRLELPQGNHSAHKLKKPLQIVFPNARVCFMSIDRRQAYAVICQALSDIPSHFNELEAACTALTGQSVNIGISMLSTGEAALPVAFRQADAALEKAFFQPEANVYLFYAETCTPAARDRDLAALLEQLGVAVRTGGERHCGELLDELFHDQRSNLRPQDILQEGQRVMALFREELDRVGTSDAVQRAQTDCMTRLKRCPSFTQYCDLVNRAAAGCCRGVAEKLRNGGSAVLDARNYIDQNFHLPISLVEVATAIGVNPNYLSRTYKSKMGVNLVDSINRKKVSAAQELLALGRLKISEVAAEVGVMDTAYFSHLFRKYTGMSPRDYQKWRLHGEPVGE